MNFPRDLSGRRQALKLISAAAVLGPFVHTRARAADPLFVNTWGGDWDKAANAHLFTPYTKASGVEIRTVSPVSYAKLAAQARTGQYEFDVTTLGGSELIRAAEAGLIEPIDKSIVNMGALSGDQVLLNGIASHAFATVVAYRKDKYPNGGPQSWKDFWNTSKFPGPRSMQRYAARVLPLALLADGVPADKLYPLDLDRGFASLDKVKKDIRVWWTQGQQSQQLLRDGEVNTIAIWTGRVVDLQRQNVPIELVWNQAQIDRAYWVVAKGTPRAKQAWQFINTALKAENLAPFCVQASLSPVNPAVFAQISKEDARLMPTNPVNYKNAVEQDFVKLGPQMPELSRRFDQWVVR